MLFRVATNPYFMKQLNITTKSTAYKEMLDVQYALRFFTVREYWHNFPGKMDVAMDNFMAAKHKLLKDDVDHHEEIFINSLNACEQIWGDDGFMRPDGQRRPLQGFFDIQTVCLSLLSEVELNRAISKRKAVVSALKRELKSDPEFEEAITQFTSNPARIDYRISTFAEILKAI
jgi:hypothetical protein